MVRLSTASPFSSLPGVRSQALLAAQASLASFVLRPCDGLADAIERSVHAGDTTELIAHCAHHIWTIGTFCTQTGQIDTLVPGCTRYPFAAEQLRGLLGPDMQLVDTGEAVARQTRRVL